MMLPLHLLAQSALPDLTTKITSGFSPSEKISGIVPMCATPNLALFQRHPSHVPPSKVIFPSTAPTGFHHPLQERPNISAKTLSHHDSTSPTKALEQHTEQAIQDRTSQKVLTASMIKMCPTKQARSQPSATKS